MRKFSLDGIAREQLERAASESTRRSAVTIVGGHERVLRQTLIALEPGARMAEHEGPDEATIQVLRGRVRLSTAGTSWEARTGDLLDVPPERHDVEALERSVIVLTVAMLPFPAE